MTSSLSAILDKAFSGSQFKPPATQKTKHIERSDQMNRKHRSSITQEQREQIVLFITTQKDNFNNKQQCLQAAFDKYKANLSAKSSSTLHRWFNLYGNDPQHNPALRGESPQAVRAAAAAELPKSAVLLTSKQLIDKYPDMLAEIAKQGTAKAFEAHPDWKALIMPQIAAGQVLYTAINNIRKRDGTYKKAGKRGDKTLYTAQHFDTMTEILNTQSFRNTNGTKVVWELVFNGRPDWVAMFNWPAAKPAIVAYSNRVRSGKVRRPTEEGNGSSVPMLREPQAEPAHIDVRTVNGSSIAVAGREYTLLDLERIIQEHREFLHAPKACPDCGYPLLMHVKAYNIALKHRRIEREF